MSGTKIKVFPCFLRSTNFILTRQSIIQFATASYVVSEIVKASYYCNGGWEFVVSLSDSHEESVEQA